MKIRNQQNFYSGLLFAVLGAAFAIGSFNYEIGTAVRMGPGYFPLLLGIILFMLGVILSTTSIYNNKKITPYAWKPLLLVISANVSFGLCLVGVSVLGVPSLGLVFGIFVLVILSSAASKDFNLKESIILATALSLISVVIFNTVLGLNFQVIPSFVKW